MQNVTAPVSLAKLFQLLGNGEDLKICEELLSLKYSGSLKSKGHVYYSLKTLKDCLTTTTEEPSEQSSLQWMKLGMMHNGNCLTVDILESHKIGKECSLWDILEEQVDQKYFLSTEQTAKLLSKSSEEAKETGFMMQGGVSCTLSSQGGGQGAKTGLYLINKNRGKITFREDFNCLDANYFKGLDTHQARTGVLEVSAVLTPDREEKRQNGRRIKNPGEPMFTLTAQDKHGVMIYQTPRGNNAGGLKEIAPTLTKNSYEHNNHLVQNSRIRRLTERECFRLQGSTDEDFEKAAKVNSPSQLYKQAGNGATIDVIYEIARRLT
jgi:site-specific DNA-cytosine methylase